MASQQHTTEADQVAEMARAAGFDLVPWQRRLLDVVLDDRTLHLALVAPRRPRQVWP